MNPSTYSILFIMSSNNSTLIYIFSFSLMILLYLNLLVIPYTEKGIAAILGRGSLETLLKLLKAHSILWRKSLLASVAANLTYAA